MQNIFFDTIQGEGTINSQNGIRVPKNKMCSAPPDLSCNCERHHALRDQAVPFGQNQLAGQLKVVFDDSPVAMRQ